METLFWALFGHVEFSAFKTDENSKITMVTGQILFAVYSLASILVVLNLLIAMLNNSYKKVDVSAMLCLHKSVYNKIVTRIQTKVPMDGPHKNSIIDIAPTSLSTCSQP